MENKELRKYQVIWRTDAPAHRRERLTVFALSLDDASKQIKEKYGSNIKTTVWNEENAAKPRGRKTRPCPSRAGISQVRALTSRNIFYD